MAYDKQTWQTGDIITAPKLNHMEDGIESAPGYHVETQNLGTLIPQQTVTTEDQGGWNVASINIDIPEDLQSPPENLRIVLNGETYICPTVDGQWGAYWNPDTGGIEDWSEYPFCVYLEGGASLITKDPGTYTVSADMVGTQLVISPEFEEAVNSCVDIPEPSTPESPLPDADGLIRNFLVTDSRGEGTIGWAAMSWDQFSPSIGGNITTAYRNRYLKIESYSFEGEVATLRINLSNKQIITGNIATQAILPIYSADGLEIVFKISIGGQSTVLYDKGTTATGKYGYGSVIVLPR